uniref:Uncharacterized protein n=1 Tax=viral metagenome TaxID=1070528 RepID=A0A6C0KDR0_9ZZZZ
MDVDKLFKDVSKCMQGGGIGFLLGFILAFLFIFIFASAADDNTQRKVRKAFGLENFSNSVCDDNPELCENQ